MAITKGKCSRVRERDKSTNLGLYTFATSEPCLNKRKEKNKNIKRKCKTQSDVSVSAEESRATIVKVKRITEGIIMEAKALLSGSKLSPNLRSQLPIEAHQLLLPSAQPHHPCLHYCHHHHHHHLRTRKATRCRLSRLGLLVSSEKATNAQFPLSLSLS
jgi:hypothetical protein